MANFTANAIPNSVITNGMATNMTRQTNTTSITPTVTYGSGGTPPTILYRGRLAGNYVYSTSGPPGGGATDIVIIAIY